MVPVLVVAYVCLGFIVRGAWAHLSADEHFLYRLVFPIHSLILHKPAKDAPRRSFSFPRISTPWAELIGFTFFASSFAMWFRSRETAEALLEALLRREP